MPVSYFVAVPNISAKFSVYPEMSVTLLGRPSPPPTMAYTPENSSCNTLQVCVYDELRRSATLEATFFDSLSVLGMRK